MRRLHNRCSLRTPTFSCWQMRSRRGFGLATASRRPSTEAQVSSIVVRGDLSWFTLDIRIAACYPWCYRLGERSIEFENYIINLHLRYRVTRCNLQIFTKYPRWMKLTPFAMLLEAMPLDCLSAVRNMRDNEVQESIIDKRIQLSIEERNRI